MSHIVSHWLCLVCPGLSQVICGNPVRALKARRRHGLTSQVPACAAHTSVCVCVSGCALHLQSAVVVTSPPSSARYNYVGQPSPSLRCDSPSRWQVTSSLTGCSDGGALYHYCNVHRGPLPATRPLTALPLPLTSCLLLSTAQTVHVVCHDAVTSTGPAPLPADCPPPQPGRTLWQTSGTADTEEQPCPLSAGTLCRPLKSAINANDHTLHCRRSLSDGTPPFHPPSSTHRLNTHPHTSHPHT